MSRVAVTMVVLAASGCGTTRPAVRTSVQDTRPQSRPASRPDPQSQIEPRSEPGDGQKFLQRMAGTWDVVKTFHGRSGAPSVVNGECVQTMIHDGRFLRSEFTFRGDQGTSTGTGTIGYDTRSKLFTSFWIDSRSTRMSIRQSQVPFTGDEIVLFSRSLGEERDARVSRTTTRIEDDGKRIVHRQHSVPAQGPERLVMELVMTRKG